VAIKCSNALRFTFLCPLQHMLKCCQLLSLCGKLTSGRLPPSKHELQILPPGIYSKKRSPAAVLGLIEPSETVNHERRLANDRYVSSIFPVTAVGNKEE